MPSLIIPHFYMGTVVSDYLKTVFLEIFYHLMRCQWHLNVSFFLIVINFTHIHTCINNNT